MHSSLFNALHIALLSMLGVLIVFTIRNSRRLKRSQDQLIQTLGIDSKEVWFRINVARGGHFSKIIKLLAYEARGLLVIAEDHIRIIADMPSGERIDRTVRKDKLYLRWLGSVGAASGNLHWFSVGQEGQELMISADTGINALQSREATADLCRRIAPQFALPENARTEFALEKHPATLAVVALFFGLLLFALVDGVMLNKNELLNDSVFGPWGTPALLLVAFLTYRWLSRREVPWRESSALAMLLSIALMLAYIPVIKRLDQFLSPEGPVAYEYHLQPDATLEPILPGPPKLHYAHRKEYWAQFAPGSTHVFTLTHGPLGLWQLDHSDLNDRFRKFYDARRDKVAANN